MKNLWNWIVRSSADPKRVSLTVRASLLMLVPAAMSVISAACGFGLVCVGVDAPALNQIVESIAALLELILMLIAGVLFAVGLIRKIALTFPE